MSNIFLSGVSYMSKCLSSKALPLICMFDDSEILAITVAEKLTHLISSAISARGACHMVFPGGRSPRRIFEILREKPLSWKLLHLYPSDERCVARGDADRNDRLIEELFLSELDLPVVNLHRIPAEYGPEEGAYQYREFLRHVPRFDVALLGVGPDGHTASLFPDAPNLSDARAAVPVHNACTSPLERVSLGVSRLRDARERWVIVSGSEKQEIMSQIQFRDNLPVRRIFPTMLFVDKMAAGL